MKFPRLAVLFLLLAAVARAQTPPAPPVLIRNGGFEISNARENLWDGVDGNGGLAAEQGSAVAIAEGGVRTLTMPVSVTVADLNGDGLLDIMTAEVRGFYRAYFNSGTKQEPTFTHAEVVPLFLGKVNDQRVPKINLFDWGNRGMADLTVGNYTGELYFLQNQGSASKPDFKQPAKLESAATATSARGLWANLLAPAAGDFNKDGKVDLLVGEGSYSANSVHLLLNKGSNIRPSFDDEGRSYLVYGDGREHLTPTIADYNGDGFPDVLCSDRTGKIGVYLHPGTSWKPGMEFKFSSFLKFGASETMGGMASICAADLNGDNLFDLVAGKGDARLVISYNRGTATEPKFDPFVPIKGVNLWARNNLVPSDWGIDFGYDRGNAYAYVSAVTAQEDPTAEPAEGKACLKAGYFPSPNVNFPVPRITYSGDANFQELFTDIGHSAWRLPTNVFVVRKNIPQVEIGKSYTLSMKVKGAGFTNAAWTLGWRAVVESAPAKIIRGDRDSARIEKHEVIEEKMEKGTLSPGIKWNAISKNITFKKFDKPELGAVLKAPAALEIRFTLPTAASTFYLDELKLTPVP